VLGVFDDGLFERIDQRQLAIREARLDRPRRSRP
jgi:hypothetical protein